MPDSDETDVTDSTATPGEVYHAEDNAAVDDTDGDNEADEETAE